MNCIKLLRGLVGGMSVFLLASASFGGTPEWIWDTKAPLKEDQKQVLYFRKTFDNKHALVKGALTVSADDNCEIYINGKKVASNEDWGKPTEVDVANLIIEGENVIAAKAENTKGEAGLIIRLEMTQPTLGSNSQKFDPKQHAGLRWITEIATDASWLVSTNETDGWNKVNFNDKNWKHAVSRGKLGAKPWGDVFTPPSATAAADITMLPGFKVELLHSALRSEGSWISMAVDSKGRLIVSPQNDGKLQRITITDGQMTKIETIDQPIGQAMGLLYANGYLYVNGRGPKDLGIYRLREKGDKYGPPVLVHAIEKANGEHGSHGLAIGPDKKLYVVSGNFTKIPSDILPTSPHQHYADDQLLPRANDGNGFGVGVLPPGGSVMRMDLDGKNCELFAAGTRNTYDIAFNPQGELFGFDSDMEWDWGMPWYRPIRITHWVSGGDYGFREGSGKFPEYYEDTLPCTLRIGIGSPTGVKFGTASNFPEKYRQAFFMMDWSYGRIFAVHLTPKGATYEAATETLLRGKPLNVTDFEFGKDGAMYFITGGRNTQTGLYRVTYVGPTPDEPAKDNDAEKAGQQARELRHKLEAFHGKKSSKAVAFAWPHLASDDRWIRYAARIAIESQPVATWKDRALAETNPNAGLTGLLALARLGGKDIQRDLLMALKKFPLNTLTEEQTLLKLRVIELSFIRQGRPDADLAQLGISKLDPLYPAKTFEVNRELSQILLYLEAPNAITKTLDLLKKAPTQEEQIYYVLRLRTITNGWTLDQRKQYFTWFKDQPTNTVTHPAETLQWFKDAERDYADGSSFPKFLESFRKDSIATLSDKERVELADLIADKTNVTAVVDAPHKFVKDWKMEDLLPSLEQLKRGRSFKSGEAAFRIAQCVQCHRFGNAGGAVGPELTAVASRLAPRDILESILEPSKVVSEQYQNTTLNLKDGDDITGRILEEDDQKVVVLTDPLKQTKTEVKKANVASRKASKLSPMPDGLVNNLSKEEVLDLITYLQSAGKKKFGPYKK